MGIGFSGGGGGEASEIENKTVTLDDLKEEVKEGAGLYGNIPQTRLQDGETIAHKQQVPSGQILSIFAAGAVDDNGNSPNGLKLEEEKTNLSVQSGYADVFESVSGGQVARFKMSNNTGSAINASGFWIFVIDPS